MYYMSAAMEFQKGRMHRAHHSVKCDSTGLSMSRTYRGLTIPSVLILIVYVLLTDSHLHQHGSPLLPQSG